MLNRVVSGKIVVLFCDGLHMAIFCCPVVQQRVTKMAGEYWNRFSSLTITIFLVWY